MMAEGAKALRRVGSSARGLGSAYEMLLRLLYWLAVLAISLALVVGLILFLESRDQSSIEDDAAVSALTHRG